ncbi:MAG: PIN domain-containing protein [Actinomycetota bacterium]
MNVFDSSALIAYLRRESGSDVVRDQLLDGGACSAANWSEVAQKVRGAGADWGISRALLLSYELSVEPVTPADAEEAALLWAAGFSLSLADRLCLALTNRLAATAWTADAEWRDLPNVRMIHSPVVD